MEIALLNEIHSLVVNEVCMYVYVFSFTRVNQIVFIVKTVVSL